MLTEIVQDKQDLFANLPGLPEQLSAGVQMARSKKACLVFFDEIDAIGGARFDDGAGEALQIPLSKHFTKPCTYSCYMVESDCFRNSAYYVRR